MTRERKIYGALLCLGLAALTADKLFFAPAEAPAETASNLLIAPAPAQRNVVIARNKPVVWAPAVAQPKEHNPIGLAALAARMHDMAEVERLDLADAKDAFQAPISWTGEQKPQTQPSLDPVSPLFDPAAAFRDKHHLIAVLKSSKGGMAILDGRSVRPGQSVDGFKLLRVGDRSAVFQSNGKSVELELPASVQLDPQSITPSGR